MQKSLTALAAAAALATVGYATAQSTDADQIVPGASSSATSTSPAPDQLIPGASSSAMPAAGDQSGASTTTTTTTDTATQTLPSPPTGVVELDKPRNTVEPTSRQPNNVQGMPNNLMTTGMTNGITRPSVGDANSPPIPAEPTVLAVTTERTTTTTTTPAPAAAPVQAAPEAAAPAPEAAPEPMPAPRADRN
jgi:hypothetical protein